MRTPLLSVEPKRRGEERGVADSIHHATLNQLIVQPRVALEWGRLRGAIKELWRREDRKLLQGGLFGLHGRGSRALVPLAREALLL